MSFRREEVATLWRRERYLWVGRGVNGELKRFEWDTELHTPDVEGRARIWRK